MLFFAWFACNASLTSFCLHELRAVATKFGVDITIHDCFSCFCRGSLCSSTCPILQSLSSLSSLKAHSAFCIFDVISISAARQLVENCMLFRAVYLLIAAAESFDNLIDCINNKEKDENSEKKFLLGFDWVNYRKKLQTEGCTFFVKSIGKHYTSTEKTTFVKRLFSAMQISSDALSIFSTEKPHHVFLILEHVVKDVATNALTSCIKNNYSDSALRVFCGIFIANSNRCQLLAKYDLKRRLFLGTTSMSPELAFLMVHMACVRSGSYIFDPFCGTGGILIAAAHYGAITMGADIDGRMMRYGSWRFQHSKQVKQQRDIAINKYTKEELEQANVTTAEIESPSLLTNFKLYGLMLPDCIHMNFANCNRVLSRLRLVVGNKRYNKCVNNSNINIDCGFLDAIITDPPYGIREPLKKIKKTRQTSCNNNNNNNNNNNDDDDDDDKIKKNEENNKNEIDVKTLMSKNNYNNNYYNNCDNYEETNNEFMKDSNLSYSVSDLTLDLILFAAETLVLNGRLVFWYPTTIQYTDDELPTHPCLRIVCNIPQDFSLKITRRLIVMEKIKSLQFPPPSREMCIAKCKPLKDIRTLLNTTYISDNIKYMNYRAKKERKRKATEHYLNFLSQSVITTSNNNNNNNNNNKENNEEEENNDNKMKAIICMTKEEREEKIMRLKKISKTERQEFLLANRRKKLEQKIK